MVFEPFPNRRKIAGQLTYYLLWCAITGFAIGLHPSPDGHGTHQELGLPPCPSVLLFGRPCPGCGLTTSFTALVHGQIGFAFHAHPLGPVLYLLFTVTAFLSMYGFVRGLRYNANTVGFQRLLIAFLIVFVTFGVVRFATTSHYRSATEQYMADSLKARR